MKSDTSRHLGRIIPSFRKRGLCALALALAAAAIGLGGCVAYEPTPAYAYSRPYYAPAPYYAPCCASTFEFDYRSGGHHWDHDRWHRWH
ncbi:MAG TPA: hypothetical protein VFO61_03985 [Alphaproteobacteria bacterium]|nr:hypothetical protein [Alphaproteobacteria bacterium]